MSLENVCNEDMEVAFDNQSGPADIVYVGDQGIDLVKIVPTLSTFCKTAGKKVATEKVTIVFAAVTVCPHTSATNTFVAGSAALLPGAVYSKAEGKLALREGDASLAGCIGGWTLTAAPNTPIACACNVEISDAGQTRMKAD